VAWDAAAEVTLMGVWAKKCHYQNSVLGVRRRNGNITYPKGDPLIAGK
jgi:hypothetical protein